MRRMIELAALACVPVLCLVVAVGCPGPSGGGGGGGGDGGNENASDNENENENINENTSEPPGVSTEVTPQDYWQTEAGGTTSQDFSEKPVPEGFFGAGCEEFSGAASFVGAAINEGAGNRSRASGD